MARALLSVTTLVLVAACADLLDYDSVSFAQPDGSSDGGTSSAGDSGAGANGGAAGLPSTGGNGGAGTGGAASGGSSSVGGASGTGGASGAGGTGATGGTGGSTGGTGATGGSGGSTGGTGATGGSSTGHSEILTQTGATGAEPSGLIPVCCVPSATEKARINEGFNLLNQHRLANGVSALAYGTQLEAAIEGHVHHEVIHPFDSHDAPESGVATPLVRTKLCGSNPSTWGENIYWGSTAAASAFDWWKGSPGHNANMLNASFKQVGIGNHQTRWGQPFSN